MEGRSATANQAQLGSESSKGWTSDLHNPGLVRLLLSNGGA